MGDIDSAGDNVDRVEKIKEEIDTYIELGYLYVRPYTNKIYLYNNSGESVQIDLTGLQKKEIKQIVEYARARASEKRKEVKSDFEDLEEEIEEGKKKKKRATVAGKRYTLEALDRSHATIIRNLTEATGWFAEALHEIGFYSTLIAMQQAKVSPEELYDKILEFKDPEKFSKFVKDYLVALLEASEDAKEIMKLRKKLEVKKLKIEIYKEVCNMLLEQRSELLSQLTNALNVMCEDCLREFQRLELIRKFGKFGGGGDGGGNREIASETERTAGRGSESFS